MWLSSHEHRPFTYNWGCMRSRLAVLIAIVLGGCGSDSHLRTADVRIAIGGRAALDFIPIYLASSLGFFREESLDVTLQDLAGTPKAVQALLGGSADVVAAVSCCRTAPNAPFADDT